MTVDTAIGEIADPRRRLLAFAAERHAIYQRRLMDVSSPGTSSMWTHDPILQQFRFCNVYRELDRVTVWIAQNWREPNAHDSDLWFAMMVARFVNWPDTLGELGYPVPWNPLHFLSVMQRRKADGQKCYGGAYMIRADSGQPGRGTAEYQEAEMFSPMWGQRERLRPKAGDTLNSYHARLGQMFGLGSFMAGQVVADLRYIKPLSDAADWSAFACSGPGSRRGLNRVLGRPAATSWTEDDWRMEAERLREWFNERWVNLGYEALHGQDFQNVLCEISKYEKCRLGEGRLKARFP